MLNSVFQNIRHFGKILAILEEDFFIFGKMFPKDVIPRGFEILTLELKLYKSNGLVIGTYKPQSLNNIAFISQIRKILTYDSE